MYVLFIFILLEVIFTRYNYVKVKIPVYLTKFFGIVIDKFYSKKSLTQRVTTCREIYLKWNRKCETDRDTHNPNPIPLVTITGLGRVQSSHLSDPLPPNPYTYNLF